MISRNHSRALGVISEGENLFPTVGWWAGRQYTSGATARGDAGGEDGC